MHKTRGEQHYLNQFKNTGKNQKRGARKQRRHVGNSNSMAGSRPSGMSIVNSRIVMAKYNQDIEQHEVVDYKTEPEHAKQLYRKNNAPLLVSHRPFQPANQPSKIAGLVPSTKQNLIRIVHLEQIHPHL